MNDPAVQKVLDEEHLRLLRIGYLISGAMSALFAVLPLGYVAIGTFFVRGIAGSFRSSSDVDPSLFGWIFVAVGLSLFVFLAGNAALKLAAARAIGRRRSHGFCLIAAALTVLGIPWGTVLGVLSFMVLERPSVKALFDAAPLPPVRS
ncbi:MAG TPA: hypothetical protein VG777_04545 [Thermoanaerobaculia bacterium]|nr:hypothetical protein [Thermoanaerobaculia bacterium]